MGPDDIYSSNGGLFIARNWPFVYYLQFAYKITAGQYLALTRRLPDWTKIDRFDIEARAEGDPTKDQMRLMVQSLLAERFLATRRSRFQCSHLFWQNRERLGQSSCRIQRVTPRVRTPL